MDASRVYVRARALYVASTVILVSFRRALTASVDSCAEIKVERSFNDR